MRKILYPFFLLSLVVGIYYFFGENFSPLIQKVLFVFGLAFAFFLFRGLFLFFFNWIFDSFSNLFKTIISGILFFLIAFGIWGALPENVGSKLKNLFASNSQIGQGISSFKNGITESVSKTGAVLSNTADATKNSIITTRDKTGEVLKTGLAQINPENSEKNRTPVHLLKNVKTTSTADTTQENSEISEEKETQASSEANRKWKKPVITYTENNSDEDSFYVSSKKTDQEEEETNKTEKGEKTTDNASTTDTLLSEKKAEKTNATIAQMKKSGIRLISSGTSKENYTVVFRASDAQIVFPVEYQVSNVLWTDSEDSIDQVDFSVSTPQNTQAEISISLSDSGENFDRYFGEFKNPENSEKALAENHFIVSAETENSVTYSTFFEGILWEITISLDEISGEKLEANDFYNILLPISFQKQD